MDEGAKKTRRTFQAHESYRAQALNGVPLATFWQRFVGYAIDMLLAVLVWFPLELTWRRYVFHESNHIDMKWDFHEVGNVIVALLYWGLANYLGTGRRLGSGSRGRGPCH